MPKNVDSDYYIAEITIPIPDGAKVFGVDFLFDAITEKKYPCIKILNPKDSQQNNENNIADDNKLNGNKINKEFLSCYVCPKCDYSARCAKYREEYKRYLAKNLLTSAIDGDIELWETGIFRKKTLSKEYDQNLLPWTTNIFKDDAIKFFKSERILLNFQSDKPETPPPESSGESIKNNINNDGDNSSVIDINQNKSTTKEEAETLTEKEVLNHIAGNGSHQKASQEIANKHIPGKSPNVFIRRAAIVAAWEIECKFNRPASPNEVIEQLKLWKKEGKYGNLQVKQIEKTRRESDGSTSTTLDATNFNDASENSSIKWYPNKGEKPKTFTLRNCSDTLEAWKKTRDENIEFDGSDI